MCEEKSKTGNSIAREARIIINLKFQVILRDHVKLLRIFQIQRYYRNHQRGPSIWKILKKLSGFRLIQSFVQSFKWVPKIIPDTKGTAIWCHTGIIDKVKFGRFLKECFEWLNMIFFLKKAYSVIHVQFQGISRHVNTIENITGPQTCHKFLQQDIWLQLAVLTHHIS